MRLAPLLFFVLTLGACESGPVFAVPAGPPIPVVLDARFPVYVMGTWTLDEFREELGRQLAKYNMRVIAAGPEAHLVARINVGLPENRQAVDVYLVRDGVEDYAGRVRVPDLTATTLDVAAQLVAPIIARKAWGLERRESVP